MLRSEYPLVDPALLDAGVDGEEEVEATVSRSRETRISDAEARAIGATLAGCAAIRAVVVAGVVMTHSAAGRFAGLLASAHVRSLALEGYSDSQMITAASLGVAVESAKQRPRDSPLMTLVLSRHALKQAEAAQVADLLRALPPGGVVSCIQTGGSWNRRLLGSNAGASRQVVPTL